MSTQDGGELETTGSHEEFWTFSQVSQWGSAWSYSASEGYLESVTGFVVLARSIGLRCHVPPREVHFAQMLLWRFYIRERDIQKYSHKDIIPLAYESAALLLESRSHREDVYRCLRQNENSRQNETFRMHFEMIVKLSYNIRIHHPSEYLSEFITSQFNEKQLQLAECIISDTFLCPCCLVHQPRRIAEGAAIMAAGMMDNPDSVITKNIKAISFIRDMKCFYEESLKHERK